MKKFDDRVMREDAAKNVGALLPAFHNFPPEVQFATAIALLKVLRQMYDEVAHAKGKRLANEIEFNTEGFDPPQR